MCGTPNISESDRGDIVAAFREILINAMEHGGHFDPSHHVEISFVKARRAVMCRVKDPGQGFSQAELRHAANASTPEDLFQHLAVRERRDAPGRVGMLIARKLVERVDLQRAGERSGAGEVLDNATKSAA